MRTLVIGLTGPFGAGVSTFARELLDAFASVSGVRSSLVKVSRVIEKASGVERTGEAPCERRRLLQDLGNGLRHGSGDDPSAHECIGRLALAAIRRTVEAEREESIEDETLLRVVIVDSLKNPSDWAPIQRLFGEPSSFTIAVNAPAGRRFERVAALHDEWNGSGRRVFDEIDERDRAEGVDHGQQVERLVERADYHVRNESNDPTALRARAARVAGLLLRDGLLAPSVEERAMFAAWSASLASMCLSRQVGAALVDSDGEIYATGYNDVPRAGGGLYSDTGDGDCRCFAWGGQICHNTKTRASIIDGILNDVEAQITREFAADEVAAAAATDGTGLSENIARVRAALRHSLHEGEVGDLLEFSRSVHAEMAVLVGLARRGAGIRPNSSLFVTTFPCHNCARHIVYSGIGRVYFVEAFAKSRVAELHDDSADLDVSHDGESASKVAFYHYEGIAPRRFSEFFESGRDRKIEWKDCEGEGPPITELGRVREADLGERLASASFREVDAEDLPGPAPSPPPPAVMPGGA